MNVRNLLDRAGLSGDGPTVLLVGDSEFGASVADGLTGVGRFDVERVDDAEAAIERTNDERPAAAVAVHDPPAIDGVAATRQLVASLPDLPVVVAGSVPDESDGTEAFEAGAADYMAVDDGRFELLSQRVVRAIERGVPSDELPDIDELAGQLRQGDAETVEALNDVTRDLVDADTKQDVAKVAAEAANEVLDFPGTSVRMYNPETHEFDPVTGGRPEEDEQDERPSYPVEDSPHARAWKRGETVIDDIGETDEWDRQMFNQAIYVPVGEYGTLNGGVKNGEFAELDVLFMEILAKNLRVALEQAEQDRQLAETILQVSEFADRVAEASTEVTAASEEVRSASQEVTEAVDEIASGASEQTEDLQQVLDEMDNLLATVEETVATADEVARQSDETADLARQGGDRADAGMTEMQRIEDRTASMVEDIRALNEEMDRISDIVELIEGIAEQTNILALNASIEAARAGEAGEGFAVVADEVKDLAEETQQSTDEVSSLISDIRERTDETVQEMEDLQDGVSESVETVADALGALERIGAQVEETNESVQEISDAIEDQADGVERTVATTERVASISEEVSSQTGSVAQLVRDQDEAMESVTANAQQMESMAADLQSLTRDLSVNEAVVSEVADEGVDADTAAASDD